MPYPNFHAARVVNPDKFEKDSFRYKNVAPGIDIIIGKLRGKSKMTAQAYRFDKEKFTIQEAKAWLKEHDINYIDFEAARSILSAKPEKKGKDLIIPFVKDETEAFDDQGNKYILTAEALDKDFKTWEGGIVTINHKVKEQGSEPGIRAQGNRWEGCYQAAGNGLHFCDISGNSRMLFR